MPISDDEFDSRQGFEQEDNQSTLSKAALRKTNKPIMEKKRRARINQCLSELKDLILEAMKKDPARHSKLEKADILEMTVRHLQATQRRSLAAAAAADPGVLPRFRDGFAECAAEATSFLARSADLPPPARARLRQHLTSCITALQPPRDFNGNLHLALLLPPAGLPAAEFPRKEHASAFRAVGNNRPPSPTSSVSSCDSVNSEPATPPHRRYLSTAFPTPPSQTSFTDSSPETQKPTVSSTTISPETKIIAESKIPIARPPGPIWRQTDLPSEQWTPPIVNSSTENYRAQDRTSPKIALDYSLTPSSGKKRAYPTENSGGLLALVQRADSPAKVAKVAYGKVSSSQYVEVESRQGNRSAERNEARVESNIPPAPAGDMWRPW